MRIEPELVEEVLDEVSTGRIEQSIAGVGAVQGTARAGRIETPYLQLVLQRLWEVERGRGSEVMRLETFRSLGGAERIVQDHLERAMRALSPAERAAAASVFGHLVTPSGSKIAHGTSDLATYAELEEGEIKPVLDSLAHERILRPLGENGHAGGRYEIFHDVLAGAVLAWSTRHEANAALEEERKRRKRVAWLATVALVGLLLMAVLAAYAFSQRSEAQEQAALAQTRSELAQARTKALKVSYAELAIARDEAQKQARRADALRVKADQQKDVAVVAQDNAVKAEAEALDAAQRAKQGEAHAQQANRVAADEARQAQEAKATAQHEAKRANTQRKAAQAAERSANLAKERAETRRYISDALLSLSRGDPEASAASALKAADLAKTERDRFDTESALRSAFIAIRVNDTLPGAGGGGTSFSHLAVGRRQGNAARIARFSANGLRIVVAGGKPGALRIYRAHDGRLLKTFRATTELNDAALSPDGKLAAAAGADGRVWVWNVDARTLRYFNHEAPVTRVVWSPAGDVLASVGLGPSPSARLWDPSTGELLHSLQHPSDLEAAVFSPDGRRLATYGEGPVARIWDVRTGEPVSTLEHPAGDLRVTSAAFSPTGETIVTGRGKFARLWEVETGTELRTFSPHTDLVTDVAFSPRGEKVATASSDSIARIWATATGELTNSYTGHVGLGINDVEFSPAVDSGAIATAGTDKTARYFAPGQHAVALLGHDAPVLSATFSPNGRSILTASEDGTARLWDPFDEPLPKVLARYSANVRAVAVNPTGSRIAVGRDGGAQVLAPNRRAISTIALPNRRVVSVAWAGGQTLLVAIQGGEVRIYGAAGQQLLQKLNHGSTIRAAAISRDGTRVATAGNDGTVRLWLLVGDTYAVDSELDHDGAVTSVAFDPTGRLLATGSGETANVWRTSDGERVKKFEPNGGADDVVTAVAFGDRGHLIATASTDNIARVWNVNTGALVNTLIGHEGRIEDVSFSPDGHWLATAGPRKAGIWQVGKSNLDRNLLFFVAPMRYQQGLLTSIAFTVDQTIVIGSRDYEGEYVVPYGAVQSYRCSVCRGLPRLVSMAKAKLGHLQAEARR